MLNLAHFAIFLPFITAIFSSFYAMKKPSVVPQIITTLGMVSSFVCSSILFHDVITNKAFYNYKLFTFLDIYGLKSVLSIRLDSLSTVMMLLVTSVSSCVHLYSISYMHDDKKINRFFSYLSMFTFFMLILVVSDDFVQLFFGWEGVGLSSYLLISFWFKKNSASKAAMKAFIANRIGDFGLIIGVSLCYFIFHTVNFTEIAQIFPQYTDSQIGIFGIQFSAITAIAIFIFVGCMGKSAQFGLHVWLPDAMEGPTPVSALIHAATMVTAGIFLVCRCFYFFESSLTTQNLILIISSITMIFAAICAVFQNDIKKTIAYSTCSQLGYMFVACAVGHYDSGTFHLVTHGFFKALLFLSAGSVIHATHQQDVNEMPKNLYTKMPLTFIMMLIGTLAITGLPPFAGFYSKDAIIENLLNDGIHGLFSKISYVLSILTVFLTSFYSWKLVFKIFFNKNIGSKSNEAHESGPVILSPMIFLSILSICAGFVGVKYFKILENNSIFWNNAIVSVREKESVHLNILLEFLPLMLSISGLVLASYFFIIKSNTHSVLEKFAPPFYKLFHNKFYIDEIYESVFIKPTLCLARACGFFDKEVLDKLGPNGARDICAFSSSQMQKHHNGIIYKYNFWQFFVLTLLVVYLVSLSWNIS